MDIDDPLVTIRMQYVEDLEDILQCPVCWELPTGLMVFTCIRGHHVCETCQITNKFNECPTCKSNFNGSRNYLAENLSSKFDDIKTSILEPSNYINRKIVKKHVETQTDTTETICVNTQTEINNDSVSTQTNFSEASIGTQTDTLNVIKVVTQTNQKLKDEQSSFVVEENSKESKLKRIVRKRIVIPSYIKNEDALIKGKCKIACLLQTCEDKCSQDTIVSHIKMHHKDNLIEVKLSENGLYSAEWNMPHKKNKSFDYAINILDMGLIFLNIFISTEGDLNGNIEVINNYCNDQQLYYILLLTDIRNRLLSEMFKGIVPKNVNKNKNNNKNNVHIFISKENFLRYLLNGKMSFNCSLTLYRPVDDC